MTKKVFLQYFETVPNAVFKRIKKTAQPLTELPAEIEALHPPIRRYYKDFPAFTHGRGKYKAYYVVEGKTVFKVREAWDFIALIQGLTIERNYAQEKAQQITTSNTNNKRRFVAGKVEYNHKMTPKRGCYEILQELKSFLHHSCNERLAA